MAAPANQLSRALRTSSVYVMQPPTKRLELTGAAILGVPFDRQRVFTEQATSHRLVHIGLHRLGAKAGLAQARQPLVGVDDNGGELGELVDADRLDTSDLHGRASIPEMRSLTKSTWGVGTP